MHRGEASGKDVELRKEPVPYGKGMGKNQGNQKMLQMIFDEQEEKRSLGG